MRLAIIIPIVAATFLLTGCPSVPVKPKFPDAPATLTTQCPDLQLIAPAVAPDVVKLSDLLTNVNANYATFHECQIKVEGWNDWYVKQKKIFIDTYGK